MVQLTGKWLCLISGVLVGAFISTRMYGSGSLQRSLVEGHLIVKSDNMTSGHMVRKDTDVAKDVREQKPEAEVDVPWRGERDHPSPLVDSLYNDATVMCLILTCAASRESAIRLKHSWPSRCNKVFFVSDTEDTSLPAMKFGGLCSDHPNRIIMALEYAVEHHLNNADWILVSHDNTFVIMENLRHALSTHAPTEALLFGHLEEDGCWSMNGGFVMSAQTVKRFVERSNDPKGPCTWKGLTPNAICTCMKKLNVTISDLKDENGKSRFHCDRLIRQLQGRDERLKALVNQTGISKDPGVSLYPISFHDKSVLQLEFFHYHFGVYGLQRPAKWSETLHGTSQ